MKIFTLAFMLISMAPCIGQTWIGKVTDLKDNKALAYVNIGVVGKSLGTVSDEYGRFKIELPELEAKDSLRFSICGYRAVSYSVSDLNSKFPNGKMEVMLKEKIIQIPEVTIRGEVKEKILGNKSGNRGMSGGFTSNQLGCEVGVRINIKKSPTYIRNFNFQIVKNVFDTLFFRVNIYNLKDGFPNQNILPYPIYYTTVARNGIISIDLTPYHIIVEEDFFISLEWVKNFSNKELKNGLFFTVRFGGATTFYRHASQDEWKKLSPISLRFNTLAKF